MGGIFFFWVKKKSFPFFFTILILLVILGVGPPQWFEGKKGRGGGEPVKKPTPFSKQFFFKPRGFHFTLLKTPKTGTRVEFRAQLWDLPVPIILNFGI